MSFLHVILLWPIFVSKFFLFELTLYDIIVEVTDLPGHKVLMIFLYSLDSTVVLNINSHHTCILKHMYK